MSRTIALDFSIDDSRSALTSFLTRVGGSLIEDGAVHLDLSKCGYFGPMFTSIAAVWSERLSAASASLTADAPEKAQLAAYANWAGAAERLRFGGPPNLTSDSSTLPVRVFSTVDRGATRGLSNLVDRFIPMGEHGRTAFETIINELCQNVEDHAGAPGALSARVFATRREVRFCVADLGVGLRASLATLHGDLTDRKAIQLAVAPHVSARSHRHNAGQGLNLLDSLVERNGGQLLLVSGKASRYRDRARVRFDELPKGISFPGTLCLVTFNVDGTLYDDEAWETEL